MTSASDDLHLAADFPQASYDDWRRLVEGVLKGARFETLESKSYDGLSIAPIYTRTKGAVAVFGRAAAAPWQIMQRVDHPDPARANAQALLDLENGATGIEIEFQGGPGARGFGVVDTTLEVLKRLFDGVVFEAGISISLNPVLGRDDAGTKLAALIAANGIDPAKLDIRFNYQVLSTIAVRGASALPWPEVETPFADTIAELMARGFAGPFALADGRPVHDAGGSEAQELAFALSVALAYLRALEAGAIALDRASRAIAFRLVADADQFLTLAKFRALRLLWARLEQACGLKPTPVFVAAETAWRMLTQRDPYVNMLRATMATFAAGLAGANAITVLPHTLALGLPDPFARRLARNTQLILLEESNLAKVADPAAGTGSIETLTQALCEAAWSLFQEIEKAGGAFLALQGGLIQSKVAGTRQAREANIARRRDALTGASEFPNLQEAQVAVEDVNPVTPVADPGAAVRFEPLRAMRLAAPFERLRDRSDQWLKQKGRRPRALLANLGTAADFTARASFAKSFFEAGGIEAIDSEGIGDPESVVAAAKAADADLVCLCSSDRVYARHAVETARALQSAGARHIYLAGRTGDQQAAGVGAFIFAGCDALALLQEAYELMERT